MPAVICICGRLASLALYSLAHVAVYDSRCCPIAEDVQPSDEKAWVVILVALADHHFSPLAVDPELGRLLASPGGVPPLLEQ